MGFNDATVKIGADSTALDRTINKVSGNVKSKLGGALASVGAAISVGALAGFTKALIEMGDAIDKASKRIGVSAEEMQRLQFAAERSGASMSSVESAFKRMAVVILDAERGLKDANDSLKALGLTVAELRKLSPEQQFQAIADQLNKIEDASVRTALAQKVFGRGGTQLLPLIRDYASLRQEIEDINGIMSNESVKAAAELTDQMTNLKTSVAALATSTGFLTFLAKTADAWAKIAMLMSDAETSMLTMRVLAGGDINMPAGFEQALARRRGQGKAGKSGKETGADAAWNAVIAEAKAAIKNAQSEAIKEATNAFKDDVEFTDDLPGESPQSRRFLNELLADDRRERLSQPEEFNQVRQFERDLTDGLLRIGGTLGTEGARVTQQQQMDRDRNTFLRDMRDRLKDMSLEEKGLK